MSYTENETIISRNVEDEMKESYLRYSMSVIIARALPDARDGLKPSQRRILYAMRQLNLSPGGKHRKCAKISGDTSGDYHPHGEQVIYPTLVRMAQSWMLRYTLVDGQGNFGSIDGDPPAAMRYTEARLTHAAMHLMEDLDKKTVDMIPNYDETKLEPTVFPAKFPNLLCNGSSGIAVGMATNIPPHNLNELIAATKLVIDDPSVSIEALMKVMPGPDFPTGGVICGYRGIHEAYHTGRGKVILRGVIGVEEIPNSNGRERLVITEIPYNVNKSRLIEHIAELVNNKSITGISDICDDSDKDGLRLVVELKKGEIPEVVTNQLYKYSELQQTFGCNMLALDKGLPRTMNIKQLIIAWVDHRIDVIRKRTRFELDKAQARAHILEGYLKALDFLDEVVKLIRSSENREGAQSGLMERFGLSEKQANAVLDLRLYQLTGLERDKINEEYQGLLEKIAYLQSILASELMVKGIIKEELDLIASKQKSERRTQIVAAEGEMAMEDLIAAESVIITISQDDYIKRMPIDTFREQRRGGQGVAGMAMKREDDSVKGLYIANTHDTLMLFTNMGRCYWLKVWQIPETGRKSKGKPLINLLEDLRPDEKVATVLTVSDFEEEAAILMATRKGVIKKSHLSHFSNPRRKGVWSINIDDHDELMAALLVRKGEQVMLFTRNGMAVRFDESKIREVGRVARGVKGATLKDESDYIVSCAVVKGDETLLVVCENGYGKRTKVEEYRLTNRGSKGVRSIITSERNGLVVSALKVTDEDSLVMISMLGQTVRIRLNQVRVMGRNTQGVKLVNLKEEDVLIAVEKLEGSVADAEAEVFDAVVESVPESGVDEVEADEAQEEIEEEAEETEAEVEQEE